MKTNTATHSKLLHQIKYSLKYVYTTQLEHLYQVGFTEFIEIYTMLHF